MRPLNKQDYLLIAIVVFTMIAGIITLLAVASSSGQNEKNFASKGYPPASPPDSGRGAALLLRHRLLSQIANQGQRIRFLVSRFNHHQN